MKPNCTLTLVKTLILLPVLLLLSAIHPFAQSVGWQTDRTVYASVMTSNTLYLAGDFMYIGKYTGNALPVPEATGNVPDPGAPQLSVGPSAFQSVSAIISDNAGGYIVAGRMWGTYSIIRVMDYGPSRDPMWNVTANLNINCLFLSGGTLYAGGAFTTIGGVSRRYVAAIDVATGSVTSWNLALPAVASGQVMSITGSASVVYLGGLFNFGSFSNLAALNAGTTSSYWTTPKNPDKIVRTLALSGSALYAGGDFATIGGTTRKAVAAVNTADGSLRTVFDAGSSAPDGTNKLRCIVVSADGNTLYVGGNFGGFQSRSYLLALSTANGTATTWNPNCVATVNAIALSGATNRLYVGGAFYSTSEANTIGGVHRNYLAAVDLATGLDDGSWVTLVNGEPEAISVSGGNVFLGGKFTSVGGARRNRLAAINYKTNTITPWNPNVNSYVRTLIQYKDNLYAGGEFTTVGGAPMQRIAGLNMTTGALLPGWSSNANGAVLALYGGNDHIYAGGQFSTVNGQPRSRLAKISDANGALDATWNPGADNKVNAISGYQTRVFVGGYFDNTGGAVRRRIAALDANNTGAALAAWNPSGGATGATTTGGTTHISSFALKNDTLLVGGEFSAIGGHATENVAAIRNDGSVVTDPAYTFNNGSVNDVYVIVPSGNYIYIGGSFNDLKGEVLHQNLSEIHATTGVPNAGFLANSSGPIYAVGINGPALFYGGAFTFNSGSMYTFLAFTTGHGAVILPYRIHDFLVHKRAGSRLVRWTAETAGSTLFEVERRKANTSFATIARVSSAMQTGKQSFETTDHEQVPDGTYYYRLKIIHPDGDVSYSVVQVIKITGGPPAIVQNTVVRNGIVTVVSEGACMLHLTNAAGQRVGVHRIASGLNKVSIQHLGKGIYFFDIRNAQADGEVLSGKITVL